MKTKTIMFLLISFVLLFTAIVVVKDDRFKQSIFPTSTPKNTQQTPKKETSKISISTGVIPNIPLKLPSNYVIHVFASGLGNPRDLVFSPAGTLLVSNPASNKVFAMPDKDNNGVADSTKVIIDKGNHIHGLAFYKDKLFVAEVDKVVRYSWNESLLEAKLDKVLFDLPSNNNHNNRTIVFDKYGNMYVSVGSTCNVCDEQSDLSATVLISDSQGNNPRVYAKGLRNAPFIIINNESNEVWGTEMGRDNLGDDIPPDEIDIIREGKNYGWPNCYGNKIHDNSFDTRVYIQDPCINTEKPLYEIPAHSAPLGLTFINSSQFSDKWQNDLLVSYHGSWNRSIPTGYKVVHMTVAGNKITSSEEFISGFFQNGIALGRPVDLIFDSLGNLYISDDKAGNVYIVQNN